ncbi:hypothetical protein Syun_024283 [Stephania yunnanensis]|uniref:Cytochrome P450 n=1 Tax=Stephania yunnanensis TaxID=152371 RepID=A0AAP0I437_9MAGN
MDQLFFHLLLQWMENQLRILVSSPSSLSLLLFFFFFLFYILTRYYYKGTSLQTSNLPPSPPKFPLLGNVHQIGTLAHRSLRDLSKKYGPIMLLHFGRTPVVVVSSRDMVRDIIKNYDIIFANRPFTRGATTLLYNCNDIAFAPYGEYWRNMRKICIMKLFTAKKVQSFKFVREEEVGIMVEKISHSSLSGTPINLSETVLTLAKNVISRCSLGKKYGEDGDTRLEELTREVSVLMGAFSFQDFFPALGWMDVVTGLVARMKRTAQNLDTLLDLVIEKHIATRDESLREDDFVELLLQGQEEQKLDIYLTRDGIKAIILDVLIAGIETTATTIEWGMAELLKNRMVMKKAQDEVRRVVGNNRKIIEEDIKQMDYLMCVIKETLRLHPVVPTLLPRQSYASTNVGGFEIPSRTWLLINVWAIQRDPGLWTQPEEFIPERFMGKSIDFKGQDFEFIPFGCGRRICLGMSLGVATVEYTMANLLYWFDWELPRNIASKDGEVDMIEEYGLSLRKKTPVHHGILILLDLIRASDISTQSIFFLLIKQALMIAAVISFPDVLF